MKHASPSLLWLALVLSVATTSASAQGNPPRLDTVKVVEIVPGKSTAPRARNVLGAEEVESKHFGTVYEAIESLRPFWLQVRGPTHLRGAGATAIWVYLDNVRVGSTDELKTMHVKTMTRATYLSGAEAQQRFGVGNESGAIVIQTVPAKAP